MLRIKFARWRWIYTCPINNFDVNWFLISHLRVIHQLFRYSFGSQASQVLVPSIIHILPTNILTFLKKQEGSTLKQYFQKKSAYISIDKCSLHDSIMLDFRLYIYLTGIYNLVRWIYLSKGEIRNIKNIFIGIICNTFEKVVLILHLKYRIRCSNLRTLIRAALV